MASAASTSGSFVKGLDIPLALLKVTREVESDGWSPTKLGVGHRFILRRNDLPSSRVSATLQGSNLHDRMIGRGSTGTNMTPRLSGGVGLHVKDMPA
jgi:hypothetical protein